MCRDRKDIKRKAVNCMLGREFGVPRNPLTESATQFTTSDCPAHQHGSTLEEWDELVSKLANNARNPLGPEILLLGNTLVCTAFDECIYNLGEIVSPVRVQQAMPVLVE